jgi:hypothetical protein
VNLCCSTSKIRVELNINAIWRNCLGRRRNERKSVLWEVYFIHIPHSGACVPIVAGSSFSFIGSLLQHDVSGNDRWFSSFQFPDWGFAVGSSNSGRQASGQGSSLWTCMR